MSISPINDTFSTPLLTCKFMQKTSCIMCSFNIKTIHFVILKKYRNQQVTYTACVVKQNNNLNKISK